MTLFLKSTPYFISVLAPLDSKEARTLLNKGLVLVSRD